MGFNIRDHTILWTIGGSRCYGMHTSESDVDTKGICVPPSRFYHGTLESFEQAEGPSHLEEFRDLLTPEETAVASTTKLEGVVYEVRKFVRLATETNPNILDVLFCRDEEVRLMTPLGKLLRDNRNLFISARARFSFAGYAHSQLKRLREHRSWLLNPPTHLPTRIEFELPERTVIPADQLLAAQDAIKKKVDSWEIDFYGLDETEKIRFQEQVSSHLAEIGVNADERWRTAARAIGCDENFLLLLDRERRYKSAKVHWDQYQNWRENRNPARAELEAKWGMDTKHAAHLYRLLKMCYEILTTGKVNVWRGDIDRDEILAIRNGAMTYDQLVEWATKIDAECDDIYKQKVYVVPKDPDRKRISVLCQEIVERYLAGEK